MAAYGVGPASQSELGTRDDVVELVEGSFEGEDLEWTLGDMIGFAQEIGGIDSSASAVMTAGSVTTWVLVRGDEYISFDTGDEDGIDCYSMSGRTRLIDDPEFREARLDLARAYGGLSPGVWISGSDSLDDELRDLTLGNDSWHEMFDEAVGRCGIAALVDRWASRLAAVALLGGQDARARLEVLLVSAAAVTEIERDLLWEIWKKIRLAVALPVGTSVYLTRAARRAGAGR